MTDEQLVDLVCQGETRRFEELVQRHQDVVYSMALRHTRASGEAEDIAQEVFLRAFRAIGSFRHEAKFSTWLYRIAYNECVDWSRRSRRLRAGALECDENGEIADLRSNVEEEVLAEADRSAVRMETERLPERYRSVVMLYYYESQSYEHIGEILGIRTKTVETRLYRARRMLRAKLTRRARGPMR